MERRLKDRVYLLVEDSFPTTEIVNKDSSEESLLEAALRGLGEHISPETAKRSDKKGGGDSSKSDNSSLPLDLYCPSNAPVAVKLEPYEAEQQQSTGLFGTKTFFVKVQYDDGKIGDSKNTIDFAWLDRSEIVDRMEATVGAEDAKFYQYML